ncbi:hypothetical protein L917_01374, partial [Phytophthora nicotianae]
KEVAWQVRAAKSQMAMYTDFVADTARRKTG